MPKENTHASFAYSVLDWVDDSALKGCLSEHITEYLLGAVSPDTFYYSPYSTVSEHLHGKAGNPTNALLPDLLQDPRKMRDMAFTCGYLTHCALDITFHPVIYYLSGNYYAPDARQRARAVYLHRHIETCMDLQLGNRLRIHALFKAGLVDGLAFASYIARTFSLSIADIRQAYRTQRLYNRAFNSELAYNLVRGLLALNIMKDESVLGLFYADCGNDKDMLGGAIVHQDLISGLETVSTVAALMFAARCKAVSMMQNAWAYVQGAITLSDLLEAIPGESLDTGKVQTPVEVIRYLKR